MKDQRDKTFQGQAFDVLGVGCAAVDDFLYVPSFPAADAKVPFDAIAAGCLNVMRQMLQRGFLVLPE